MKVMQYVFNHTTFDPENELDQKLLAAYRPLGVEPGKTFDAAKVAKIDGNQFGRIAQTVQQAEFARSQDPAVNKEHGTGLFQPKGRQ